MAVDSSSFTQTSTFSKKCLSNCSGTNSSASSSSTGSGNNSSSASPNSEQECPLCLETLDLDDKSFYPCTCGYQICRFCWHRILSESSHESKGSCPACRKPYSENPANFKPLSVEDVQLKLKQQRKQKDQQKKAKTVDSRKHLGELRVVQKNLVFVVGITPRIADPELLKKGEYFGRFGRIHKIVVNSVGGQPTTTPSTTPSYGAYITYKNPDDALRAIQSVNNIPFDGKTIKASLGTTKYCSHFMRNQPCPKGDCMYLHAQGEAEASFTKEDMQMGKHQEYERKLIEEFNNQQQERKEEEVVKKVIPPLLPKPRIVEQVEELIPLQEEPEEELQEPDPTPTELESSLDFDPFYETQQAFESIIQAEMANWTPIKTQQQPPPGFNSQPWAHDEWIDPAIIYSSNQQQSNIGHLLGSSLLNDIFSGSGSGEQMGQRYHPHHLPHYTQPTPPPPPYNNYPTQQKFNNQPPPGFQGQQQQQQQFINNNFFNNFPF